MIEPLLQAALLSVALVGEQNAVSPQPARPFVRTWDRIPQIRPTRLVREAGIVEADVQLECSVGRSRRPTDCVVLAEQTPGLDLGLAAIEAAEWGRLTPEGLARAEDGKIRFTIGLRNGPF